MTRARKPTAAKDDIDPDLPAPALPADRDVDDVMRLLLWGRAKGFRIGPIVRVGSATVQVQDIRQAKGEGAGVAPMVDVGIDAEYGLDAGDEPVEGTAG